MAIIHRAGRGFAARPHQQKFPGGLITHFLKGFCTAAGVAAVGAQEIDENQGQPDRRPEPKAKHREQEVQDVVDFFFLERPGLAANTAFSLDCLHGSFWFGVFFTATLSGGSLN